jgi:hypothetical protein
MTTDPDAQSTQHHLPTPEEVRRGLHWSERWRDKVREGTRLRRWYDSVFPSIEEPTAFTEPHDDIVIRLTPRKIAGQWDEERTEEILEEARSIFQQADERGQAAERRATTLQGAVAIAASLVLAGGALLADPAKVQGEGWRIACALGLVAVTFCFVMAGWRALATTSRIHVYHAPTQTDILRRSGLPLREARIELAAETLKDFGYNTKVANWKVAHLRAAAEWFSRGLIALLLLAVVLAAYGVFGPEAPTQPATTSPASDSESS